MTFSHITAMPVSKMTYTVSSGTLNSAISYHTITAMFVNMPFNKRDRILITNLLSAYMTDGTEVAERILHTSWNQGSLQRLLKNL